MTRFIFSLMMLLLVLSRPLPAQAERTILGGSSKKSSDLCAPIQKAATEVKSLAEAGSEAIGGRLARLTAYWSGEGDYYTRHHMSASGVVLHRGHCAVDPSVIPYGSVVQIAGLGNFLAVDTGTAVVSRRAAREAGRNRGERNALVIDLYFENRSAGENFAATGPKYASISWSKPDGEVDLGMSNPAPQADTIVPTKPLPRNDVKVAATKPLPKCDTKIAAMKPLPRNDTKVAAAKPLPKSDAQVASTKILSQDDIKVASVKPVSKRDTEDTVAASSKSNLKDGIKIGLAKAPLKPEAKCTPKPTFEDDGTEHILLAQADAPSHRKALYQF